MTNIEIKQHLINIATGIDVIEAEVEGINYDEFINEEQTKESVYSQLQIIGQEAHHLSMKVNKEDLAFDPRVLSNLRNARYNQVAEISHANVWNIITHDLIRMKDDINQEVANIDTPA